MWQPIPLYELKALIAQQIAECSPETRALFEANAIAPQSGRFPRGETMVAASG